MATTCANLLNLSIHEAHRLINISAYERFVKALGRPRLALDNHIISMPTSEPRVITCRIVGTDRYVPLDEVATVRYGLPYCKSVVRKRALPQYVEASTHRPVDLHYDKMSADKNNIVTVRELLDCLSSSSKDISPLDLVRLYFLQHPSSLWQDHFTTNHLSNELPLFSSQDINCLLHSFSHIYI